MIAIRVPTRFSLLGGGSDLPSFWKDYQPCEIVSMALPYYNYITYTIAIPYSSDKIKYVINTPADTHVTSSIGGIKNDLIRVAFENSQHDKKLKHTITTSSDVSIFGSGLGGSSSFAVGMAMLFNGGQDVLHTAIDWELNKLGSDIGWQDHIITYCGGFRYIHISSDEVIHTRKLIGGDILAKHCLMFDLHKHKNEAGQGVANHDLLTAMKQNMAERSIPIRRTLELMPYLLSAINNVNIIDIGRIINEAWILKMESHKGEDYLMSLYNLGLKQGAYGGKVSGSMSKGSGHLFFIAPTEKHEAIIDALSPYASYRPVGVAWEGARRMEL